MNGYVKLCSFGADLKYVESPSPAVVVETLQNFSRIGDLAIDDIRLDFTSGGKTISFLNICPWDGEILAIFIDNTHRRKGWWSIERPTDQIESKEFIFGDDFIAKIENRFFLPIDESKEIFVDFIEKGEMASAYNWQPLHFERVNFEPPPEYIHTPGEDIPF